MSFSSRPYIRLNSSNIECLHFPFLKRDFSFRELKLLFALEWLPAAFPQNSAFIQLCNFHAPWRDIWNSQHRQTVLWEVTGIPNYHLTSSLAMESSRQKCYIVVDSVELSDFPLASSLLRNESSSSFLFPSTPSPTSASSSSLSMTLSPSTRCLSGWIANDLKAEDPQSSHQRNPSRTTSKEADAIMIMTRQPDKPRTTFVAMRNNIQSAYCPHKSWRNSYSVAALGVLLVFALMSHVAEGKGSAIFGKGGTHTGKLIVEPIQKQTNNRKTTD